MEIDSNGAGRREERSERYFGSGNTIVELCTAIAHTIVNAKIVAAAFAVPCTFNLNQRPSILGIDDEVVGLRCTIGIIGATIVIDDSRTGTERVVHVGTHQP